MGDNLCNEDMALTAVPANADVTTYFIDCNEDWRLGAQPDTSLLTEGSASQCNVAEASASSDICSKEEDKSHQRTSSVCSQAELEEVGNGVREFYRAYVAECKKRSRSVHKCISAALNDKLEANIQSGNMDNVRCIDLSGSLPPISDQDVHLMCLALLPSKGNVLKRVNLLKLCDNDIGAVYAAKLIAVLMYFGNGQLQLDLSRNQSIRGIDAEQLSAKFYSSKRRRGLHTLVLDGCGIRSISQSDTRLLSGLRSLSLCYTGVSNLWSTVQALKPLALKSLSFQGSQDTEGRNDSADSFSTGSSKSSSVSWNSHESPVCREKAYREFIVHQLSTLRILDGKPITSKERTAVKDIASEYYELDLNDARLRLNSILRSQQVHGTTVLGENVYSYSSGRLQKYARLSARALQSMTTNPCISLPCPPDARPRQFEYNPMFRELMVYGTVNGDICLLDHEQGRIVGTTELLPDMRSRVNSLTGQPTESRTVRSNAILGLCWTNKDGKRLLAGADNGTIRLFDAAAVKENRAPVVHTFDRFDELTSLNINCEDQTFLVSGYSEHIAVYDLPTGKQQMLLRNCHSNHINVLKFSHYSPSVFATSSFDHDMKLWDLREPTFGGVKRPIYSRRSNKANVMVCFSPDDRYLLTSAVDNEVWQYHTYSGEVVRTYDIRPTYSSYNFTRSYFMNGGDYFVTGSCCENVVRIFNSSTGQMLRDFEVENKWFQNQWKDGSEDSASGMQIFVQSLRGDPVNPFNFSVLAAASNSMSSAIVKVDLMKDMSEDL
eukprot:Plantae.Rhodophyta-Purpureofilum_apyrenoidigerum.ctg3136.p1 GENE.Plantae.Rhodophyta-Purpureofilum_apyrenoidigerum.ctg3136~~Plantae.Rhodophyta-Purpureofilum_apyrenoidigerum.ctg3136.p1  ORF type:complete len:777 (+),score=111.28 Plantae.Rhodophyta-Purpureofilum_apyrenoidigerum.ctg3136:138-2468(+)